MRGKPERIIIPKEPLSDQLHADGRSALERYKQKVLGNASLMRLIRYELSCLLFGNISGALGYQSRKLFFRHLFRNFGSGVILGRGLALRHPEKISLGDRVAVDDNVMLDAGGAGHEGITIGDEVIISRNCVVQGKSGPVSIGRRSNIGCNTTITAASGIHLGEYVLVAGNCYIGGARYITDRTDIPMMVQGMYSRGPVVIGNDVWIGAGVTVMDGVRIGNGSVVGAGSLVTKDLPEHSIAFGLPARVVRSRNPSSESSVRQMKGKARRACGE